MDIERMREFVTLAHTMNFTKAARIMHLSQSALSNHIMQMEKELGVSLVDRTTQKIRLTVAGYNFLETSSLIINSYDSFLERRSKNEFSENNHIVVQTLQHADQATHVLLTRIRQFCALHPDVQFEIRESLSFDVVNNIEDGTVDCGHLGLYLSEPEPIDNIDVFPIVDEEVVVWIDKSLPQATAEQLSPQDLEGLDMPTWTGLGHNSFESFHQQISEMYDMNIRYVPRYCISREDFFLNKITSNDVVLLTMGSENIHSIAVREDRILRTFEPTIYEHTCIAFRADKNENSALALFEQFMRDEYARDPYGENVLGQNYANPVK
ncbi:Hca operon transcriptional activator [Slackia heliotrinireducens]|uniref:Transcriptional regulator n=1 Tax=Slackia heliotrinireducens (strain ATCC 29202 / DSM 20476 / NCTC 11029 / RHS 1) TaxID=471855 RepID=C7N274_SLAHD|nr:LysR family transcriptional regulator [Slackia heliotrinireducens]ACV21380.1 transcriptional regulator [Slackia heliotrinireducens DSM 20476]VEG98814.1 Hca operon transcriptional activator [Slackia heliotrinireducens]